MESIPQEIRDHGSPVCPVQEEQSCVKAWKTQHICATWRERWTTQVKVLQNQSFSSKIPSRVLFLFYCEVNESWHSANTIIESKHQYKDWREGKENIDGKYIYLTFLLDSTVLQAFAFSYVSFLKLLKIKNIFNFVSDTWRISSYQWLTWAGLQHWRASLLRSSSRGWCSRWSGI